MSELTDGVFKLIEQANQEERRLIMHYLRQRVPLHPLEQAWGTTAEAILTAIARSTDLTQRGIRGILAEATFEESVLPLVKAGGWKAATILGDQAYDFLLARAAVKVRIQVKLQRRQLGVPKEYAARSRSRLKGPTGTMYVVEVQKTRSGEKNGVKTRPYRFGEFDILAVNMHPATGDWKRFIYTVGTWLLPRAADPELIEIFQPVPDRADDYWTDDLNQCIDWFLVERKTSLYSGPPNPA